MDQSGDRQGFGIVVYMVISRGSFVSDHENGSDFEVHPLLEVISMKNLGSTVELTHFLKPYPVLQARWLASGWSSSCYAWHSTALST